MNEHGPTTEDDMILAFLQAEIDSPRWRGNYMRSATRASTRDDTAMVGILVHGDNHFIVRGPLPNQTIALALARQWSLIQIGATTPTALDRWHIISREFRENLEWAVVVPGDREISPAVATLLDELSVRGITIHDSRFGPW